MKYQSELDVMLESVKNAMKLVLKIYHGDFSVSYKEDKSEVTNADLMANQLIKENLTKNFPNYAILSEESKDNLERLNHDYCFIIDPVDGTRDFVNKTDQFAINVALCYKHEIVVGVIGVPCLDLIYYATKDSGAYKLENGIAKRIFTTHRINNLTMYVSNFFFKNKDEYSKIPQIKEIIPCGSSYKACLIAEGKGDICFKLDDHSKEWDTAPQEIILKEAGGIVTDMYGNIMKYNKVDYINHNGFIMTCDIRNIDTFKKEQPK